MVMNLIHFSNRESSLAIAASAEEPAVAGSILECAEKDAETLDWLSIPADQRIIDDKSGSLTFLVYSSLMMSSSMRKKRT